MPCFLRIISLFDYFCPLKVIVMNVMKYIIACMMGLLPWVSSLEGQIFRPYTEVGGFAGVSYYLGDVNPRRQFYNSGLSLGALIKHNFTEHHCLRFNVFYGELRGNDLDFKNEYQQMRAHSFETSLLDFHVGYEFNFMPYIINRWKTASTPYMFAGLGYSLILSSTTGMATSHATIPFGVGYKYRFNDRLAIGCEWGLRKTFTDKLDGLLNPGAEDSYSASHNNDWYSFAGVYVTFRIFEKRFECPGVKEQIKYR